MITTVSSSENINTALVSALERYREKDKINWSIAEINSFKRAKMRMNMEKSYSGGPLIRVPMSKEENRAFQAYQDMSPINIRRTDILTVAQIVPKQYTINVALSERQILDNKGDTQAVDLVKACRDNAMETIANQMSRIDYGNATRDLEAAGLQNHFSDDGLGTVQGLDASIYTWWQNQHGTVAANADGDALVSAMVDLHLSCSFKSKPDLILVTNDWWRQLAVSLQDKMRTRPSASGRVNTMPGPEFDHFGAMIYHDFNSNYGKSANRLYMLNSKTVGTLYHEDRNWSVEKKMKPIEQDAIVIPMYWMGNNVVYVRKNNGLLTVA